MDDSLNSSTSSNDTNAESELCGFTEGYTMQRFIIIVTCSGIAAVGAMCNFILLAVFRRSLPSSVFLAGLALLDALLCLTYLLLFGIDASYVYLESETLFYLYHKYLIVVFFICRVVQFAMPYMLILATLERFTWTAGERIRDCLMCLFSDQGRMITAFFIMVISFCFRSVVLFAMVIQSFDGCEHVFRTLSAAPAPWIIDNVYYEFYDVNIITALQTVIPFFVLLILNTMIVIKMCGEKKDQGIIHRMQNAAIEVRLQRDQQHVRTQVCTQHMIKKSSIKANNSSLPEHYVLMEVTNGMVQESMNNKTNREKAVQLRNAVITMLVIVLSYLICNGLHLFLLYHEKFEPAMLYDEVDQTASSTFYIVLSDSVSIFYMISSAIRLFIYAKCNPKLRRELQDYMRGRIRIPLLEDD